MQKQECIPVGCVPSTAVTVCRVCPGGGVCLPGGCVWPGRVSGHGGCLPRGGVCPEVWPGGCLPRRGVCQGGLARGGVWPGGVWPGGIVCVSLCVPVNRMTDRCLLKHYLAATTLRTVISSSRVTDTWLYLNNDSLSMIVLIYSDKCSCWPLNANMFNSPCLCQHSNPKQHHSSTSEFWQTYIFPSTIFHNFLVLVS